MEILFCISIVLLSFLLGLKVGRSGRVIYADVHRRRYSSKAPEQVMREYDQKKSLSNQSIVETTPMREKT